MIYTLFLHRSPNLDNAPFQTNLTKEWMLLRVNSYTNFQGPLLERRNPLPGILLL